MAASTRVDAPAPDELALLTPSSAAPVELERRLSELQTAFLDALGPLDDPERRQLWLEMAAVNAELGQGGEASLCWANALWEMNDFDAGLALSWQQCEKPIDINRCDTAAPSIEAVRSIIAGLFHAAQGLTAVARDRLAVLRDLIEKNERSLPFRLAWLAHFSLHRLAKGDVLALARARDRALERLFEGGLRPELDLPSFARFSSKTSRDRLAAAREHLVRLRQHLHAWLRKHPRSPCTPVYADLTIAFGLARLGHLSESETLLAECGKALKDQGPLHHWLYGAYVVRVRQAARGEPARGPLPADALEALNQLADDLRYKGDRLRQFSRILEPHEKIDARFRWYQHYPEAVERELAFLAGLADPTELRARVEKLLSDKKKTMRPHRGAILAKSLELAPRIGEEFALGALARILDELGSFGEIEARLVLLEKAICLAAHYDQAPFVSRFVEKFFEILESKTTPPAAVEPLLEQLFRGLRKFGMRDVVGDLLERLTDLFLKGDDLKRRRQRLAALAAGGLLKQELAGWKTLLHVAGGWLYFGQEKQARPILDETRELLFQKALHPLEQGELANLYVRCLGQADVGPAVRRWLELFRKLERIDAVFTTDSHFSLAQLSLVESLVLTLASDDFALDQQARHWLEDDEYLIRRRIHRDVRQAMQEADV